MNRISFLIGLLVLMGSVDRVESLEEPVLWQLGEFDGSNREFIPYSNREFALNTRLTQTPGYDPASHSFLYRVPEVGRIAKPAFPGGLSGRGSANPTWVNRQTIVWDDDGQGWRHFRFTITSGLLVRTPGRPHKNVDEDDLVQYSIRVTLPDGNVQHVYVPNYVENPIEAVMSFPAREGENRIELLENSGYTYRRCFFYDALGVYRTDHPVTNPATLEIVPAEGFAVASLYDWTQSPRVDFHLYNLPAVPHALSVECLDFFDEKIQSFSVALTPDAQGRARASMRLPASVPGSLRVVAEVHREDRPIPLQMGNLQIVLRAGAVRRIAPLTEQEIDMSFLGFCGLGSYLNY
ncbi:MAG: hypothetical protein U1E27_03170, partial [Kiritimatiellia bacterium]|nr:hypothetical protein [Kiritimatiellia bacterium]